MTNIGKLTGKLGSVDLPGQWLIAKEARQLRVSPGGWKRHPVLPRRLRLAFGFLRRGTAVRHLKHIPDSRRPERPRQPQVCGSGPQVAQMTKEESRPLPRALEPIEWTRSSESSVHREASCCLGPASAFERAERVGENPLQHRFPDGPPCRCQGRTGRLLNTAVFGQVAHGDRLTIVGGPPRCNRSRHHQV